MSRPVADPPGPAGRPAVAAQARVVVLTRAGCHLCEEAERVAASVCGEVGASWRAIDVDADARLRAEHTDHVPVTFVDGARFALWFLDPDALRAALTRPPGGTVGDRT